MDFEYSTKEGRQQTALTLLVQARSKRGKREVYWQRMRRYYEGAHEAIGEVAGYLEESGMPPVDACVTDAFIQVESQINPVMPSVVFKGRDDDLDGIRAKQREYAVKFVLNNNAYEDEISLSERAMLIDGDAFIKVFYDESMGECGDIRIMTVPSEQLYFDPAASSLDGCEYIDFLYPMHVRQLIRIYGEDIKAAGIDLERIAGRDFAGEGSKANEEHVLSVLEHWYRDEEGDICCSMSVGGEEFKHIERYWLKTGVQNKSYPFVHLFRIRDNEQFYNRSEIEQIIPLIDSADRALLYGLINAAFTSNDIIIAEKNALEEGTEIENAPGSVISVRDGRAGGIRRLGGLSALSSQMAQIQYLQNQIQRTTRNYDSNIGKEPTKVTTASGLAQLRADAQQQRSIKTVDRLNGYKRLFELIDWSVLEFYDDERMIFIGVNASRRRKALMPGANLDEQQGDILFTFNADNLRRRKGTPSRQPKLDEDGNLMIDEITGAVLFEELPSEFYYPRVDVIVTAGEGEDVAKSYTIEALMQIAEMNVSEENIAVLSRIVEALDIQDWQSIVAEWERRFRPVGEVDMMPF